VHHLKVTVGIPKDVFEPLEDTEEFQSRDRQTSAIHIKVFKTVKLPPLSSKK
jgi:hypothetical protein